MDRKQRLYRIPVYRLQLVQEGRAETAAVAKPADVAWQLKEVAAADREHVVAIFLDTKNRPMGRQVIGIGTLNATLVEPRELFKAALLANAAALIVAHNHPSGDVTPSRDDDELTRRVSRAGALLSVRLLDHVILAPDGGHFSYRDSRPDCIES